MELVRCSSSSSDRRVYKPACIAEYPSPEALSRYKSRLLHKIHNSYRKALERLTITARPTVGVRLGLLGGGGLCLGLLDPVSNIVVNALTPCKTTKDAHRHPQQQQQQRSTDQDLERRSLEGLVAFLTRFFPYLADCEAVRYLVLADADALVACRIIVADRCLRRFGSSGPAAVEDALRMALRCGALAAGHPDPDRLVGAWRAVSNRLGEAVDLLAKVRRRSPPSTLRSLARLLVVDQDQDRPTTARGDLMMRAWQLARSRSPRRLPYQLMIPSSSTLKRALLDTIHGLYLQALARLPAGELRSRYHRSLLKAGHCYGPLDPVSNIIVNTVWYDAAFPRAYQLDLDLIGTLSLHRIEARSMYGLVSFLCTRYHDLDFRHATRCLIEAGANLMLADDQAAGRAGRRRRRQAATRVDEAMRAAAVAAHHPDPDAQANILGSCKQTLESSGSGLSSLLPRRCGGNQQMSSEDAHGLARLLVGPEPSSCSAANEQPPLLPSFPLKEYVREHTKISNKVIALLNSSAPKYELHVICGVNDQVSGPVYSPGGSRFAPHKCYRSHVNFLATIRGSSCDAPVLFFAELSNDDESQGMCCPVLAPLPCAERTRCLYCDYVGTRIVHPIDQEFHGRELEFERMVCGEDPCDENFDAALSKPYYTNMRIINNSGIIVDEVGSLKEDCLYPDSLFATERPMIDISDDMNFLMEDDEYDTEEDGDERL